MVEYDIRPEVEVCPASLIFDNKQSAISTQQSAISTQQSARFGNATLDRSAPGCAARSR
jgi:hypothetical protein